MGLTKEFLDRLTPEQMVERLSLALEGTDLGIWDWDLRDNSVQFDRRWCEMLGLDHATTPQVLDTWSSRVHPDDIAGCYADIQAHLQGRTPRYENVHRMRHADGEWRYILDQGRISGRDEAGAPIRFTGTHTDITMRERAREQAELDEAARLATLSRFAATLAHELNTPLQVITMAAEVLERHCGDDPAQPAEVHDSIRSLLVMAGRAGAITRALRVLARDARADAEEPVPVSDLLGQVHALSASRFASRGVRLTIDDYTAGACIAGRPSELLRALLTLTDNAFDAAGEDGWARVEAERHGDRIVLRCVDSGTGVPAALIPRIGTPHFSTKAPGTGAGLGLSSAKALVEHGRGELAYVADAEHTTFELRLPAAADRADG